MNTSEETIDFNFSDEDIEKSMESFEGYGPIFIQFLDEAELMGEVIS